MIQNQKQQKTHIVQALRSDLWNKYSKLSWKLFPPFLRESKNVLNHDILSDTDVHYCEPVPAEGLGNKLPVDAVEFVAERCDVLFRDGFGIIKGDILEVPEYGILSYHSGDIRTYRGKPAGFWEYMRDSETCGITLQQLTETLDGGQIAVYSEVDISGLHTWRDVRQQVDFEASGMLAVAINSIETEKWNPQPVSDLGKLYTTPNNREMIQFLYKNTLGHIQKRRLS